MEGSKPVVMKGDFTRTLTLIITGNLVCNLAMEVFLSFYIVNIENIVIVHSCIILIFLGDEMPITI